MSRNVIAQSAQDATPNPGHRSHWTANDAFDWDTIEEDGSHLSSEQLASVLAEQDAAIALWWEHREHKRRFTVSLRQTVEMLTPIARIRTAAGTEPDNDNSNGWNAPRTLTSTKMAPALPVHVLPTKLREWISGTATALQVPPEIPFAISFAAVAAASAGRFEIEARPGWIEPLNLYLLVAAAPGERKSPVVSAAMKPLQQRELDLASEHASELATAREAVKEDHDPEADQQLRELEHRGPRRLLADDITPEMLARLMHKNDGRLAIINPEGGGFFDGLSRYGNGANIELVLKAHPGERVHVDRVGGEDKKSTSLTIERPLLTLGLAVQPSVVSELVTKRTFADRGLPQRFLYLLPESKVGNRDINPPPVDPKVIEAYEALIKRLLDVPETGEATRLKLAPDARAKLEQFMGAIEPRLADDRTYGWTAKLAGAVLRIAGLLHLAAIEDIENVRMPSASPVSADEMMAAIEIGKVLWRHAEIAFSYRGSDPILQKADKVLSWIRRREDPTANFTRRDVHQGLKGSEDFKQSNALIEPLQFLIERGWIRLRARAGKSEVYEVNPHMGRASSHSQ